MIDTKKMVKTNDFYDWYPEVLMAANGSTRLCCTLDFKYQKIKYKVSYFMNNRRKEMSFNVLEDAVNYYNERI